MYYLIKDTLESCSMQELHKLQYQYVAVLTPDEWQKERESFDMGIDMEIDLDIDEIHNTKAEVNYDSLTGTFLIPDRDHIAKQEYKFAFALDEKGIVFIDSSGKVDRMVENIKRTKKWRMPSLERFIYDFLEQIIHRDLSIMEKYELELDRIEADIMDDSVEADMLRVNEIRSDIRDLRIHYEQLIDLGQELEENENNFFKEENERYFHLFSNRMARLHDTATSLRDYTMQVRDLYQAQLDVKQNRIMKVLTVVTTVFMPLTLIVGWYGMNFKYMPELETRMGYPVVIVVSIVIIVASLIVFKKKKWL